MLAVDINEVGLAETLDQTKDLPGEVRTRVTDLRQRSECIAAVEATVEAYGHLHVRGQHRRSSGHVPRD